MIEVDPTVDYACKRLLGDPAHSRLTIHFLNAVLKPDSPIVKVDYLNPFIPQEFYGDKLAILDILATDEWGRRFNIEVQRTNPGWLPERLTYYATTQLVGQITEGDGYDRLRPSICICILKATMFPKLPGYHHEFRLRTMGGVELTKCLEIHILELPKYRKGSDNKRTVDPLDQWMDFFSNAMGANPIEFRRRLESPIFDEAIGVLEMILKTEQERRDYYARLRMQLDENTRRNEEEAARAARAAIEAEADAVRAEADAVRAEAATVRVEAAKALEKGKAEGKAEQIRMLQEVLEEAPADSETLCMKPLTELDSMIEVLRSRLRDRLSSSKE
jgi:predicted transposase/invertase (TIGR01784 family)